MSNFSFSHSVFKRLAQGLVWERVQNEVRYPLLCLSNNTDNSSLSWINSISSDTFQLLSTIAFKTQKPIFFSCVKEFADGYQHFLLFPQGFQKLSPFRSLKLRLCEKGLKT